MRLKPARAFAKGGLQGLFLACSSLVASNAAAVGTRTFDLDTLDEFSGGDLKGVAVSSDGGVRAGFNVGNVPLTDASSSFSALALGDGSVLVGTGPSGKVFKVTGDRAALFADTGALAVTAMIEVRGTIYAASMPDGKIFKLSQGKAEPWVTLPNASHVWALAADARGAIFAATGPEGRVYRIEPSGANSVYFRSDEPHIVSLALGEAGELYAGSSGKGILYKIAGPGRAVVLYDFSGEEVKAIAVGKKGTLYAIANDYGEPPEPPKRSPAGARSPAGPTSAKPVRPGKGALWRFDATGRPEKMMAHTEFHYMSLATDAEGRPYVGTGAEGRVYTVDDAHTVTLVADTDDRQIGALAFGKSTTYLAGSDPATVHRVVAQGGSEAVWTSKVLDAGLRARFGHLSWHASGPLEFSTRTGNTSSPDPTWSGWSAGTSAPTTVTSPAARFIQVRARWSRDPKAVLSEVMLPFVTENVRPVVLEVEARPKNASKSESKESIPASGSEPPKHDSVLKVTWRVDNPDNDSLRYRLNFRREGQGVWRDALRDGEILTKSEYEWETTALPEGKYRLRVEASDEPANPPDLVQRHALESGPVLVDNTPPVVRDLTMTGRRLKVRVVDGLGPIARVEMAVDGKPEFRTLGASDGVFDTADESVDVDVTSIVPPGSHIVAVRAYDAAGNYTVREIESR
ncbi:hypothetical protein [Pendulispora albinea]|uniref:Uncharacterized protein n=1 Tax=Pendulispora albinea TaxID=2741071 RepID=A0ABZ2LS59_9BACT